MDAVIENLSMVYSSNYTIGTLIMSLIFFLIGGMVASFTGLIVHRMESVSEDGSLLYAISFPPSHCEGCQRRLNILELIPVLGWLVSGGKCRSCNYKVPWTYPAIEALVGVCTVMIPLLVQDFNVWTISLLILLWVGLLTAWIDIEYHIIPEEITWVLLFIGLLMSPAVPDVYDRIIGAALCAFVMWMSMFLLGIIMRKNLYAGGDVSFAAVAGAWVGVEFVPWYILILSATYVAHSLPQRLKGIVWVPMGQL